METDKIKKLAISIQKEALKEGFTLSKKDLDFHGTKLSKEDAKALMSLIEDEEVLIKAGAYDKDLKNLNEYIENAIDSSLVSNKDEAILEMCKLANSFNKHFPKTKLSKKYILSQLNSAYEEHGFPFVEGSLDELVDTYHQVRISEASNDWQKFKIFAPESKTSEWIGIYKSGALAKKCIKPILGEFEFVSNEPLPTTVTQEMIDECPESCYVDANDTYSYDFYQRVVARDIGYPIIRRGWKAYLVKDKEAFEEAKKGLVIRSIKYVETTAQVGDKIAWEASLTPAFSANSLKESRNSKELISLFKANDTFEAACDKVVSLLKDAHIEEDEVDDADDVVENMEMCLTDVRKALKSLKKGLESFNESTNINKRSLNEMGRLNNAYTKGQPLNLNKITEKLKIALEYYVYDCLYRVAEEYNTDAKRKLELYSNDKDHCKIFVRGTSDKKPAFAIDFYIGDLSFRDNIDKALLDDAIKTHDDLIIKDPITVEVSRSGLYDDDLDKSLNNLFDEYVSYCIHLPANEIEDVERTRPDKLIKSLGEYLGWSSKAIADKIMDEIEKCPEVIEFLMGK